MSKIISWFSAGISSAIATKIAIDRLGCQDVFYIKIDDEHPDNDRFIAECQEWFGIEIKIMQSPFKSVDEINRTQSYMNSPYGAPCTKLLKVAVRRDWEKKQGVQVFYYVWGFDCNERNRIKRLEKPMPSPEYKHIFPLIDHDIDKSAAHCLIEKAGIKRPVMYELGYPNNNCIGCVKGKYGYWNKIRKDFPAVFKLRSEREREIGASCINGTFLDELQPGRGRNNPIVPECGFFCEAII